MKVLLVLLCALLALSFAHDDQDYDGLCDSGIPSPFGDGYLYLGDMTTIGAFDQYSSGFDSYLNRTYYWNICGYDDNEEFEAICSEDNAVCYAPEATEGQFVAQAFFPAGSFEALTAEVIEDNDVVIILLNYQNGVYCEASGQNMATSFALVCDENATSPILDGFLYTNNDCDVTVTIRTSSACIRDTLPEGCSKFWGRLGRFHYVFWGLASFLVFCCCCTCCSIIKKRRAACKRRNGCHKYTELPTQADNSAPIANVAPQVAPQSAPQIVQIGGQYFATMNGIQYPVQMVPAPQYAQYMQALQQQNQFSLAPLAPTQQEEVVDLQTSQLEEDEKFARQLQSQLNH